MATQKRLPWNLIIGGAVVVAIFVAWFFLPVKEWIQALSEWVEKLGFWGGVIYGVFYAIATVLLVPGAPLTIAAGLVFGVTAGFPVVLIGATIGAALAFLAARYLVREKVQAMIAKRPTLKAVDRAVAEEGWKIVAMVRLTPIMPFNLQNYFFGLTDVRFWHYVAATLIGIVPGVLLYLYLGAIGGAALTGEEGKSGGPAQWAFFGIGLAVTIAVIYLVTKKAKAKLKEAGVADAGH